MTNPRLGNYPKQGAITIPAGEEHKINRGGDFIRVKQADQSFTIRYDDGVEIKGEQNDVFRYPDNAFKNLTIVNDSGSALTFQLEVGFGLVETNNVSISGTIATEEVKAGTISTPAHESVAAQTTESILAANTDRTEVIIRNPPSNTHDIVIGDSNAGAARGITLAAGEAITLTTTAQIYCYNSKTAAQSVEILEID